MKKIVLLAAVAALAWPAPSLAREKVRHARPHQAVPSAAKVERFGFAPQSPARMIQLPNGRWVSSYGCYTEDAFGRFEDCGSTYEN